MEQILEKYAHLLVHYCLAAKPGDKLYVVTTFLAEPLVKEVYREALAAGAAIDVDWIFPDQARIFAATAQAPQYDHISPLYAAAVEEYQGFLYIKAPYLRTTSPAENRMATPPAASARRRNLEKRYMERTGTGDLRRNLCLFPTQASADDAHLPLDEYAQFVYQACKLHTPDPIASWLEVRAKQEPIVQHLNRSKSIRYVGPDIDLTFSTENRIWINSDGQTNMPSGEVYTTPVEDSVNGVVKFNLPAFYQGEVLEGVTLWVEDGYITRWEAQRGQALLDAVFQLEGTRRFGEAAIGTNYDIDRVTGNILFDEKIGGTVHLAIGQSYPQTGGKNQSSIHWDLITDLRQGGAIYTDGEKIYENGRFLI